MSNKIQELVEHAKEKSLPKTYGSYEKVYDEFDAWCQIEKQSLDEVSLLAWCAYKVEDCNSAPTTISSFVSKIKSVHYNKTGKELKLVDIYKYLNAEIQDYEVSKASSFSIKEINSLLIDHFKDDREGTLNSLFVLFSLSGFCRKKQIDSVCFEKIIIVDKGVMVTIPELKRGRSKDKPKERSFIVPLDSNPKKCGVHIWKKYLDYLNVDGVMTKGKVWKTIRGNKFIKQNLGIHKLEDKGKTFAKILQKENWIDYTSHWARHTAASNATELGISVHKLQIGGGWKSEKVAKDYVDHSMLNLEEISKKALGRDETTKDEKVIEKGLGFNSNEKITLNFTINVYGGSIGSLHINK